MLRPLLKINETFSVLRFKNDRIIERVQSSSNRLIEIHRTRAITSVTILDDLLNFGQLFKAFGNNKFAQISHIFRQFLSMC